MSEIHEPDLDRAFAALTSDLTTRSSGPGAGAVVVTARKRRRTRVGVVAFVAAAVVVAFAAPSLTGGTHTGPADGPHTLPAPAPLSASSLTEATRGWTGAWEDINGSNNVPLEETSTSCLDGADFPQVQPQRSGAQMFVADARSVAVTGFKDYSNDPATAHEAISTISENMTRCGAHLTESTYGDVSLTHGSVAGTSDQDVMEVWLARVGDRMASLFIVGPAATAPADATWAVTQVFLAAIQDESSYETTSDPLALTPLKGLQELPTRGFGHISLDQVHEATGAWSKDWAKRSSSRVTTLPCISGSWPASKPFNGGSVIGDRGTLTFAGSGDPVHEVETLLTSLADCKSAQWTPHRVDRTPYDAGWASYDGGSVFLAVSDYTVASLRVRGLGVPSEAVAAQMIGLLEQSLAHPTSDFGSP